MKNFILYLFLVLFFMPSQGQIKSFSDFEIKTRGFYQKQQYIVEVNYIFKSAIAETIQNETWKYIINKKENIFYGNFNGTNLSIYNNNSLFTVNKNLLSFQKTRVKKELINSNFNILPHKDFTYFIDKFKYLKDYKFSNIGDTVIKFSNIGETVSFKIDNITWEIKEVRQSIFDLNYGVQIKNLNFLTLPLSYYSLSDTILFYQNNYQTENFSLASKKKLLLTSIDTLQLRHHFRASGELKDFLIIDFFYQSCLPCIKAIAHNIQMLSTRSDIEIIGVDPFPTDTATMEKFKQRYKINYAIIDGSKAAEIKSMFINSNQYFGYPTILVFKKLEIDRYSLIKFIEGYDPKAIIKALK